MFFLWGILHLWVGFEGTRLYLTSPAQDQWRMFIGGAKAPFDLFHFPTDPVTSHVQANLILNFCYDVAGYGVLGIVVSWLLWRRAAAQRSLAVSMACSLWLAGIHVALIIVEGAVDLVKTRARMPDKPDTFFVDPAGLGGIAWGLAKRTRRAWSFEVEARPFREAW